MNWIGGEVRFRIRVKEGNPKVAHMEIGKGFGDAAGVSIDPCECVQQ